MYAVIVSCSPLWIVPARKQRGQIMKTAACAGKGGVGKTLTACAIALNALRQKQKTLIIDFDEGHAVRLTLGVPQGVPSNVIDEIETNLSVVVVDALPFVSARAWKETHSTFEGYFDQFSGDLGIVALADMVEGFFGVPTDVIMLQRFAVLVETLNIAVETGVEQLVIDVEPTAGLQRLFSNADATLRSLQNLKRSNRALLSALRLKWRDIVAYIEGTYIQNIEHYADRIERALNILRTADYMLIAIPKVASIEQTFKVRNMIEGFGAQVKTCALNDLRGEPEEQQFYMDLRPHDLPVARIHHIPHFETMPVEARRAALIQMSWTFLTNASSR